MEYGLAALITAIFVLFYVFTRTKEREIFTHTLKEDEFERQAAILAKECELPERGSKKQYDVKKFVRKINFSKRTTERTYKKYLKTVKTANGDSVELYKEKVSSDGDNTSIKPQTILISDCFCNTFAKIIAENKKKLKEYAKADYSNLAELPSVYNTARIEKAVSFALEGNKYLLIEDRIKAVLDAYNRYHTLTYSEINSIEKMTEYILLKKLSYVGLRIRSLVKLRDISYKIARKADCFEENPKYKELKNNLLFIYFCAESRGESAPKAAEERYNLVLEEILSLTNNIFLSLDVVKSLDFTRFYSPLELISQFDVFQNAENAEKHNFLCALSKISDEQNTDEYAFAYVLARYLRRTSPPAKTAYRLKTQGGTMCLYKAKNDLCTLARALTSSEYMSLTFGEKVQNGAKHCKSILQIKLFNNSFAPYTSINTVDFGISVVGDNLTLKPNLPQAVESADFVLEHNGVKHQIVIRRSEESGISVNGTSIEGVPNVKLGAKPLKITLYLGE